MRVLLTTLNSKYIHSNLSIRYLYMAALKYRRNIELKEFTINNDENYIYTEIVRGEYDLLCFSCYIWNIEMTLRIAENLKKAKPNIKILFGGPEVSFEAISFMRKYKYVDFVIIGAGEDAFERVIAQFISKKPDYRNIESLVYRESGKIFVNEEGGMDGFIETSFPYSFLQPVNDKIVYYETTRGCPYSCSYCLSSVYKGIQALPIERVRKEIGYFLRKYVKQVKLIDRTFNYDVKRSNNIIRYIIENDNSITNFHFEICAELVDDEFVELMSVARAGLFQLEIGVQSTNVKTLEAVGRSTDIEKLLTNIKKLTKLENISVHVDLIAGLPYEDFSSFIKSFNDAYALEADNLQLGFLKLLKGTAIRNDRVKYGYAFRDVAPYEVISSKYISAEGIARLKMVETILELYHNKGGFWKTVKYAISIFDGNAFDFYEQFAYFFYLKGYQHRSHKKEDLYRIFYEYASWKDRSLPGLAEKIKETLVEDMESFLNPEVVKRFEKAGWSM
ncbi:MAG: DUF4080 domain-containing protein [Eubacteriales bacterium]